METIKLSLWDEGGRKFHPHQQDEDENRVSHVFKSEDKFTFVGVDRVLSLFDCLVEFLVQDLWQERRYMRWSVQ